MNGKPTAMSYKTKKAKVYQTNFEQYVKNEVIKQKWDIPVNKEQHFYFDCTFYFPRTDMDCNNYFKCMLDAITNTKCIWEDDNVVCERVRKILYDNENPRIEIEIKKTDYIGVFADASQLSDFEDNCIECVRYKRNCSLLKNAKAGKIQEEINGGVCSKYSPVKK